MPGHWEGDLLTGAHGTHIATLVERNTRFTMLVKIPRKDTTTVVAALAKHISKQGDRYLRSLFTAGALAVIRCAKIRGTGHRPWLTGLLARRPTKVVAIALANKLARMAWAMMARNERYKEPAALAA